MMGVRVIFACKRVLSLDALRSPIVKRPSTFLRCTFLRYTFLRYLGPLRALA
jgi:hypothetical protein